MMSTQSINREKEKAALGAWLLREQETYEDDDDVLELGEALWVGWPRQMEKI